MDVITLSLLKRISNLEARVEALEPSRQLFNIEAISDVNKGSFNGVPCVKSYCKVKLSDVCPSLTIGKEYTISICGDVSAADIGGTDYFITSSPYIYFNGSYAQAWSGGGGYLSFTMSAELYNSTIEFCDANVEIYYTPEDPPVGASVTGYFWDIMVNEGTEPLPWEPYKK